MFLFFNWRINTFPCCAGLCHTITWISHQFSSVIQPCLTLCNPMDCSTPGCPVHHQVPELAQTHVHWAGDAIQSSPPLLSLSPPALNLSQQHGLFQWVSWNNPWNQRKRGSKSQTLRQLFMNKIQYLICRKVCSAWCHLLQEALPRLPLSPLTSVLPLC